MWGLYLGLCRLTRLSKEVCTLCFIFYCLLSLFYCISFSIFILYICYIILSIRLWFRHLSQILACLFSLHFLACSRSTCIVWAESRSVAVFK
jgi:hypothetical protein